MPNNISIVLDLRAPSYKEPPKAPKAPARPTKPLFNLRPKKALLDLPRFSRKRSEFKAWLLEAKAKLQIDGPSIKPLLA